MSVLLDTFGEDMFKVVQDVKSYDSTTLLNTGSSTLGSPNPPRNHNVESVSPRARAKTPIKVLIEEAAWERTVHGAFFRPSTCYTFYTQSVVYNSK